MEKTPDPNMNVMYPSQGLGACNEGGGEEEEAREKGDQGWAINRCHLQLKLCILGASDNLVNGRQLGTKLS